MSKPKKMVRHTATPYDEALLYERSKKWKAGILNTDIAVLFAQIITGFEHIETSMEVFL